MEERVLPPSAAAAEVDLPQLKLWRSGSFSSPTTTTTPTTATTITTTTNNNNYLTLQLPGPPGHSPETYVVQFPKDQIYRVPPPENALYVENHRLEAAQEKNKTRSCCKNMLYIGIVLVVIGLLIGVSLIVIYHSFTPKSPIFSVSKLQVKQHKDGRPPTYDVTLKAKNPNEKMGIKYGSVSGSAKLTFWTKTLGSGQFPSLNQNSGESDVVHIKLDGPEDQSVPPNVQRSMNDKGTKHQISLSFKFKSPLVLNVWALNLWKRDMEVKCDFRVSTMGEGTKILNQNCKTALSN